MRFCYRFADGHFLSATGYSRSGFESFAESRIRPPSRFRVSGETIEARFDPLDPAVAKPAKAAESQPTGINFVDLLIKKKDEEEPPW